MKLKYLTSQFVFTKQQRVGMLLLCLLMVGLLFTYFFIASEKSALVTISSSEVTRVRAQIDSLRAVAIAQRKPKKYPFNPNYITDYKAYTLGMTPEAYDKLKAYRNSNKWINSETDFKQVTGVSDSLLAEISPYFKFPDWVTNPKPKNPTKFTNSYVEKTYAQKIDLNTATVKQLQEVSGIGPALSQRIVLYRDERLGGFSNDVQLNNVYGLREDVVTKTLNLFTVKTPKPISKININNASASDIATIPGISFELAKELWEFVKLRGGITDISELEKIEQMSARKLTVFQLYLSVE